MWHIALTMLVGDKVKYYGLIFGVTFATLLMAQQVSIFVGIMARAASVIRDVTEADIWVMDPRVRYVEEVEPLREIEVTNVRSVDGVLWAVPFFKGLATLRLSDGLTQQVQLIGVDNPSLIGLCRKMYLGDLAVITDPQSAVIDKSGYQFMWPDQSIYLGREVELNDNRLVLNAVCDANATFLTYPVVYVSYNTVKEIIPPIRNPLSYILVKAQTGVDKAQLVKDIQEKTGLLALPNQDFAWHSIRYLLERTGIPINFGLTILLSILIGAAITAQTFYLFVVENTKQFAAMKAIGFINRQLFKLVIIQASIVAIIGYSLGIGFTALFFALTSNIIALKGFVLYWQVMLGAALLIGLIIVIAISFSLRRVVRIDPALVFRD
jgi:putative ABC transport system permease protein